MSAKWDLKAQLLEKIKRRGGFINTHLHLDRAYTITLKKLEFGNKHLHEKWELVNAVKRRSTVSGIYDRMAYGIEKMLGQGVQALGSFIDVDDVIRDKAIKAAERVRERYKGQITIKYINQTLKGVISTSARKWFEEGAAFCDIIGGLPAKDAGREAEHIDILMQTAKDLGKMVHIHVDQLNTTKERETELVARKAREHSMQGKVVVIHAISLAAHPEKYRQKVYKMLRENGVMVISCPTAWIDSRRREELAPTHNAITPVDEMVPAGITVALGTDNIADIYKPFSDGDVWTELRFLLEACHFYDINELTKIATINGRKVLGLD